MSVPRITPVHTPTLSVDYDPTRDEWLAVTCAPVETVRTVDAYDLPKRINNPSLSEYLFELGRQADLEIESLHRWGGAL